MLNKLNQLLRWLFGALTQPAVNDQPVSAPPPAPLRHDAHHVVEVRAVDISDDPIAQIVTQI
jgi:hypothetical protein